MIKLWKVTNSRSSTNRLVSTPSVGPWIAHCAFLNEQEIRLAGYCGGRSREVPFPTVQLKITLEDFDADFFLWNALFLVSERMRQAMALDQSEVRFFEVDASQSAPLPRSKNYQIMEPTITEEVSDPEASHYGILPMAEGGHIEYLVKKWGRRKDRNLYRQTLKHLYDSRPKITNTRSTAIEAHSILMKSNAAPKHELFYDRFFYNHLFCTEAFALRVLEAGCAGVSFIDPSRLEFGVNRRYRTLRGIEEDIGWDEVNRIEITKLVEVIE